MKYSDFKKNDVIFRDDGKVRKETILHVETGILRGVIKIETSSGSNIYSRDDVDVPEDWILIRDGITMDKATKEVLTNLQEATDLTSQLRQMGTLNRLHQTACWMTQHGFLSARLKVTSKEYGMIQNLLKLKAVPNPENPKFMGYELMVVGKDGKEESKSQAE